MEIGNHTTFHRDMRHMTPAQIQAEVGNANNVLTAALSSVPGFKIETMAVPMGRFPSKENVKYLIHGQYDGQTYDYKCAMAASWRPIPSPDSKEFNPLKLERISPIDGLNGIRYWIKVLSTTGGMYARYVSDGDPNVISYPKGDDSQVNVAKIKAEGKLAYSYSPFGGPGGAKPIVAADSAGSAAAAPPPAGDGAKPIVAAADASAPPAAADSGAGGAKPIAPAGGGGGGATTITEKPITTGG
jgi:peptidoglycan/xylan/chitin deacetylase (PgdA/CDA1 family)